MTYDDNMGCESQNELTLHLTLMLIEVGAMTCDDLCDVLVLDFLKFIFSCFEPFEPFEPFSGSRKARCSSRPWASMAVRPRRPWRRGQASRPFGSPRHATTCDDMRVCQATSGNVDAAVALLCG